MSLPKGWAVTSMGDIRVDSGSSIDPRQHPSTEFVLYSVPQFDTKTPEVLKGSEIGSSKQTVALDTVLLCKINPRINRVWVVEPQSAGTVIASTEWIPFFKVPGIKPKYLAYFLQQNEIRTYLAQNVSGVGGSLMRVRPAVVDRFEFKLAPEPEQDRIVAEIEKQFTRLDDAVAALKRVQANLKRYRASVLKAACEGRLVPTEAELARKEGRDYEPASELLKRILAERRAKWEADQLQKMIAANKPPKNDEWKKKYKEPTSVQSAELPLLPEGWTWTTADQLCIQITDGEHIQPPYQDFGRPMLSAMHVRDGVVEFRGFGLISQRAFDLALQRCAPASGDVLIVSVGATTGRAAIVQEGLEPFAIVRSVLLLKAVSLVNPISLLNWVRSPSCQEWIKRASGASAQPHFYIADTKRMPVPLPPAAEAKRIVDECQRRLSLLESVETSVMAQFTRASHERLSILQTAFSGKLVPQDPNDEPASVLLERIRAERARAQEQKEKTLKAANGASPVNGQRRKPGPPARAAVARDGVGRRANKLAQPAKAGKG